MAGLGPLPRTAWLEIDLAALVVNLSLIRTLAGGAAVHPVVKADAYGHGAVAVAAALEAAGADGFCVATYDEAVELRTAGLRKPILVLYPIPDGWAADAARRRVEVAVGDPVHVERLAAMSAAAGRGPRARPLGVHLEIESGLGRGGIQAVEAAAVALRIERASGLRLAGVWTHLQQAEDEALTALQLGRFEAAIAAVQAAGVRLPPRHVVASAGLLLGGIAALDGVRPGLSTYGLVPDELLPASGGHASNPAGLAAAELQPVLSLRARPVRVAEIPAGWGISYGPTFTTTRPSRIATLPLGYGDGWPRSLSNRASVLVRGQRAPIVGNVAMDAIMVDVTNVPGGAVTLDEEFVLIGSQGAARITVAELALARGTNSWEVVTGMGRRLARVYHAASGPVEVRTLLARGAPWPASKSGTATSATSRSTRS